MIKLDVSIEEIALIYLALGKMLDTQDFCGMYFPDTLEKLTPHLYNAGISDKNMSWEEAHGKTRTWLKNNKITIAGYKVEFNGNGIQVGCTSVSKEQILAIAKRFNNES